MNCLTATRRRKPEDNGFLDRSFSLERPRCAARTGLTMPADARASGLGIGQCCCAVIAQLNHGLSLQVRYHRQRTAQLLPADRLEGPLAFAAKLTPGRRFSARPTYLFELGGWSSRALPTGRSERTRDPCSAARHVCYSIISSARASSIGGTVSPNALAVLRLTTSSNSVGCSIGSCAGLAPLRTRST